MHTRNQVTPDKIQPYLSPISPDKPKEQSLDDTCLNIHDISECRSTDKNSLHYYKCLGTSASPHTLKDQKSTFDVIDSIHNSLNKTVLSIQPRYIELHLKQQLLTTKKTAKNTQIEHYEIKLYNVCKRFSTLLSGKNFSFDCVDNIHHIFQLKGRLSFLTEDEIVSLDRNLESVLQLYPTAWVEYNILNESIQLLSALLIKWKMISKYNYSYRVSGRGVNVRILDMIEMNKNILTMETLWLSVAVQTPPFRDILDESVKQYASILQGQTLKTVRMLLRMNEECDFSAFPSIEGIVAAKQSKMIDKYGLWPDFDSKPIPYQRLRQPSGLIARCFKNPTQYKAQILQEHLAELELVYRTFERDLIGNILYIFGMNGDKTIIPRMNAAYYDN